jgi:hypothetical protein
MNDEIQAMRDAGYRPVVVDTDIASWIFNWHSSAKHYVDTLRGSELVLCFMSVAEMHMSAFAS